MMLPLLLLQQVQLLRTVLLLRTMVESRLDHHGCANRHTSFLTICPSPNLTQVFFAVLHDATQRTHYYYNKNP